MKPIGGFFEMEALRGGDGYHTEAVALSTGRSCLGVILGEIGPSRVHLPYYTCDAVVEAVKAKKIPMAYYGLDTQLDPVLPVIADDECAVYINYFGLKAQTAHKLALQYGSRLI